MKNNKLPAMEEPEDEIVLKHLNAMQAARKAFTQVENSERIKRALRHPMRSSDEYQSTAENVFYKREDSNRWHGPATVIGQDSKVVFFRHGSRIVRVAVCRLVKLNPLSEANINTMDVTNSQASKDITKNKQRSEIDIDEVGSIFDDEQPVENSHNSELGIDELEEQAQDLEDQSKQTR